MRWLPKSFVIHQWVVEANKLSLSPISVSLDGMKMQLARSATVQAYNRMAKDANDQGVRLKVIWAYRSSSLQREQYEEARKKHGKRRRSAGWHLRGIQSTKQAGRSISGTKPTAGGR